MNILAIDSTDKHFSFSYQLQPDQIYQYISKDDWQHAESILDKINSEIKDFSTLDYLVVSRGPGSFTGLRIGLAIAKAFKIALPKIKIITPTHFQIMANIALSQAQFNVAMLIIDAKRGELVAQRISSHLGEIDQMSNFPRENLELLDLTTFDIIITDSMWVKEYFPAAHLINKISSSDALDTAIKLSGNKIDTAILEPLYFRPSDAKPMKL